MGDRTNTVATTIVVIIFALIVLLSYLSPYLIIRSYYNCSTEKKLSNMEQRIEQLEKIIKHNQDSH